MNDVKHTPGPWVLDQNVSAYHLIAAAPELLAACRAMVSWNDFAADEDSDLESLYEEAIRRARAAIAKAEGTE